MQCYWYWGFIAVLIILIAGCGGGGTLNVGDDLIYAYSAENQPGTQAVAVPEALPPVFTDPTPGDPITYAMIAGQSHLAGYVYITNDGSSISIELESIDGWEMSESAVYLGHTPPDGQGSPGQFPIQATFDPWVTSYTFPPIPLADYNVEYKSMLFFAIHVNVHKGDAADTSWAGDWNDGSPGWDFGWDHKWGGFMHDCLQPVPDLTDAPQAFEAIRFGSYSYWDTIFNDQNLELPPGEFLIGDDKYYSGWCGDMARVMYQAHTYFARLYSSYDPALPANPLLPITVNGNLEFVNYMINQRRNPTSGGPFDGVDWTVQSNYLEFQDAVWYFTNEFIPDPGSLAEALAQDAMDNGDNYIPCQGEWYSIVLYPDTTSSDKIIRAQMILIEVDP